jgi:uncharacterized protein
MTSRAYDPLRLDVPAFAKAAATLDGEFSLPSMARLAATSHPDTPPSEADVVQWQADAAVKSVDGGARATWMHLHASANLRLQCQRCLLPLETPLELDVDYRFVADEATALAEDPESDEDLLVLSNTFNLRELVEEELLLAMPLVPRHDVCPVPVVLAVQDPNFDAAPDDDGSGEPGEAHPFAALAALKRTPPVQ